MCSSDIFLGVLAILFPPLPVWVKRGICSADSVINILLCFLGFLPGLLHAWYIIAKFPEPDPDGYESVGGDAEYGRGRASIIIVQHHGAGGLLNYDDARPQRQGQGQGQGQQPKSGRQGAVGYGTSQHGDAGSSVETPGRSGDGQPPPSYAQVVMGDNKIQDQARS